MKNSTYIFVPTIDIAARLKNPELKKMIREFKERDDTDALVEEVLKAQLLIPATPKIEWLYQIKETGTFDFKLEQFVFPMLQSSDGKSDAVAFTDIEEFLVCDDLESFQFFIVTDFYGITKMALTSHVNGMVINPFGTGIEFPKSEIKKLKQKQDYRYCTEQKKESIIFPSEQLEIWEAKAPVNLMASLVSFCLINEEIELLYYFKAKINGKNTHLIIADYTGDVDTTFDGLKNSAKRHIKSNERFCILPFGCVLAENITKGIEPLYKKRENNAG